MTTNHSFINKLMRFAAVSMFLFVCAGIASAQGEVTNTNTTSSDLTMTATVQTSVRLDIETNGGLNVGGNSSTGQFNVAFGNLNGLGTGTPSTGVTKTIDGTTGTLYTTPITLRPHFSGFTGGETADITVTAGGGTDDVLAREGLGTGTGDVTTVTATPKDAALNQVDNSATTRNVGFYINRTTTTGAKTAILKYTIIVRL